MKFLFWNVNKNPVGPILSKIVKQHDVEIVILAECLDEGTILVDLNAVAKNPFHLTDSKVTRVVIYTQFPAQYIKTMQSDRFVTIRHIFLPQRREILLAAMHLESKLRRRQAHQSSKSRLVSTKIRQVESELGITSTVLVGDLNMNPFEMGVIQADGLHGVMTRAIANRLKRAIGDEVFPYFYNPMWGRFGDTTKGPPGTYYYDNASFDEYFWNTFDQVLIRPELMNSFDESKLEVLTSCRGIEFLRGGKPDRSRVSDHLPLLFDVRI